MKHILRLLRLVSDSRITEHHYSPNHPIRPAGCPVIAMKWVILIGNTCFVTEVVGMN